MICAKRFYDARWFFVVGMTDMLNNWLIIKIYLLQLNWVRTINFTIR